MSRNSSMDNGPRLPDDKPGKRLWIAIGVSVLLNILIFANLSTIVNSHFVKEFLPVTVHLIKTPPKPKPAPPKVKQRPQKQVPQHHAQPQPQAKAKPQATNDHPTLLTSTGTGPATGPSVVSGAGPAPTPTPVPTPVPTPQPTPTPIPTPTATPTPAPTPTPGITSEAVPLDKPYPDIPDDLDSQDYNSFVRVIVDITASGATSGVTLVASSGNLEVDQRVLDAMKRWKWKPALVNGQPAASSQHYRFDFEVN